jgi:hypothetical protein
LRLVYQEAERESVVGQCGRETFQRTIILFIFASQ